LSPQPQLTIGKGLAFPLDVVTRRTAILGQTGTGKTSTAVVMVEEADAAGARFVVIDPTGGWYGLKSNAAGDGPGVDCVVIGGQHGDVPLDEHSGRLVAELVANEGYNLVLDLERLPSWGARLRFVADFLSTLYELAHSQILVVIDEAHRFAPQNVRDESSHAARCLGAVVDVVALGRRKGLGAIVVTQRLAKLHKDVLELCEVLIAHRLRGNNDLKALKGWIEEQDQDVRAMLQEVAGLDRGVARVSAPTLGINGVHLVRPKHTFDSSRSIDVGEVAIEPKVRAHVDLSALERLMADTLEKQRADDPEALRARIRELEQAAAVDGIVETAQDAAAERERLEGRIAELEAELAARKLVFGSIRSVFTQHAARMRDGLTDLGAIVDADDASLPAAAQRDASRVPQPGALPAPDLPAGSPAPPQPPARSTGNGDAPPLKAGARRMLDVLCRYGALRRRELAVLSRVSPVSGTVSDYLSVLRQGGYVTEDDGLVEVTPAGRNEVYPIGNEILPPYTPEQVYAMWQGDLKAGARRMVEQLMRAHPDGYTRRELAGLVGISPQSGTVSDYLSVLRRRGLAEERNRRVYAGEILYLGQNGGQR
jgi:hypothetical protein